MHAPAHSSEKDRAAPPSTTKSPAAASPAGPVQLPVPPAPVPPAEPARAAWPRRARSLALPLGTATIVCAIWWTIAALKIVPEIILPSPEAAVRALIVEIVSGHIFVDIWASTMRVAIGFGLSVLLGIPLGLVLGHRPLVREALVPGLNFLRNLSPLTWIPFAILWFGVGDAPAIFLIFFATFFPLTIATMAAVANVPQVFFQIGREYGWSRGQLLWRVTLPGIAPQLITALRVTSGISWLVVVAAEMAAGRSGLGFLIWDARNGLRTDLLVAAMLVIGIVGTIVDHALTRLTRLRSVRWGYG